MGTCNHLSKFIIKSRLKTRTGFFVVLFFYLGVVNSGCVLDVSLISLEKGSLTPSINPLDQLEIQKTLSTQYLTLGRDRHPSFVLEGIPESAHIKLLSRFFANQTSDANF